MNLTKTHEEQLATQSSMTSSKSDIVEVKTTMEIMSCWETIAYATVDLTAAYFIQV